MTDHQEKQKAVIDAIETQVETASLSFSTVAPVSDFEADTRMALTSVHFPHLNLLRKIQNEIISPLRETDANPYYYPIDSLHMTIKNVRIIKDPPPYTKAELGMVAHVFSNCIPKHHAFMVYFYRLLLFPNSLALIGTTDPELDEIILDLNNGLKNVGVADDKVYLNEKYFFCNMTLARFDTPPSTQFRERMMSISSSIDLLPYTIDSVTLLTCNAALMKRTVLGQWNLMRQT